MSSFSVVDAAGVELGEHPLWDPVNGRVGWIDVFGGVLRWLADGRLDLWHFPSPLGVAALRRSGGVVAAAGDAIHFRDASGRVDREPITGLLPEGVRFNDGACDPDGHFLFGTMAADGQADRGSLYRLTPDGDVEVLEAAVTESNGLAWSRDGRTLYYVDSAEPVVRRYEYRPGTTLKRQRDLCTVSVGGGFPDGLCMDGSGAVWVGIWDGAELWRVSPEGELMAAVVTPTSRPTCAAFGGLRLDRLFVATAWEGLDEEGRRAEPWAGHLLVCDPQVPGAQAHAFAG
jgi:sugar lactone lactonase YvrE